MQSVLRPFATSKVLRIATYIIDRTKHSLDNPKHDRPFKRVGQILVSSPDIFGAHLRRRLRQATPHPRIHLFLQPSVPAPAQQQRTLQALPLIRPNQPLIPPISPRALAHPRISSPHTKSSTYALRQEWQRCDTSTSSLGRAAAHAS